jgi:hypothetical protein
MQGPPPLQKHTINTDELSSLPVSTVMNAKRQHLEICEKQLMNQIKFQKSLGEDYSDKYTKYLLVCEELNSLIASEDSA